MNQRIPTFAVVGHPNKGKSSIVATLAEDDEVAISATPGTTRKAMVHTFSIDGEAQYALVDTPGFQRPGELLAWLRSRADSASDRPGAIAAFIRTHADDPRFVDECELLRPLVAGAGILYVVDGAKPYGPEYELEMEILQWTGRPRMALINMIGSGDHQASWKRALGQYFAIVRVFDAMHSDFDKRTSLLRAFGELDEQWRAPLERAVVELERERSRRRQRSAAEIADCLIECLTHCERDTVADKGDTENDKARLSRRLLNHIRKRERQSFERVAGIYRHERLARESTETEILDADLFTSENWEVFGLSQSQLAVTGALSGAAAGGGVDLLLGGASLLLGAGIGAIVGGVTGWLGSGELARTRVLGNTLGGRVLQVGPVKAVNFPWVLLGRAWLHQHLVSERNHAYRDAVIVAVRSDTNLMDSIPDALRRALGDSLRRASSGAPDDQTYQKLSANIDALLGHDPATLDHNPAITTAD